MQSEASISQRNEPSAIDNPFENFEEIISQKRILNRNKPEKMELNPGNLMVNLAKNTEARVLRFKGNAFLEGDGGQANDKALKILGRMIESKKKLQELDLQCEVCNGITEKGVKDLFEGIRNLTSLRHLTVNFDACHQLADAGIFSVSQGLKNLVSLQSLSLNFAW